MCCYYRMIRTSEAKFLGRDFSMPQGRSMPDISRNNKLSGQGDFCAQ